MRRLQILVLVLAASLLGTATAITANAAPTDPFVFQYFIDGASLPSPLVEPKNIAVNHETGNVLVYDQGKIDQLDAEGNPVDFPALGSPQLLAPASSNTQSGPYLVVDNSGGPTQGNFYLFEDVSFGGFFAFHADGSPIGKGGNGVEEFGPGHYIPPNEGTVGEVGFSCGGGLAPNGNIWFADNLGHFAELTPSGLPTGKTGVLGGSPEGHLRESGCTLVFDGLGSVYVPDNTTDIQRYSESDFSYQGETGLTTFTDPTAAVSPFFNELAIDPVSRGVYMAEDRSFTSPTVGRIFSVPHTDPPAEQTQTEALGGLSLAKGFAFDATGQTIYVSEGKRIVVFHRQPAAAPRALAPLTVERIRSQGVVLGSSLIANGAPVTYHFEYGTDTSYGSSNPPLPAPKSHFTVPLSSALSGLQPDTTYHVRLVATNAAGTTYGPDTVFTTYPAQVGGPDPCPNALARKQTSARQLPDCRGYELVSAADTGGYDVESSLVPGQAPFPGYPQARDRVLYAVHGGAIPGPWNATNRGPDPYLATRGASGWRTSYLGLPANLNPQAGSFSSVLGEADQRLSTLAFAGPGLCSPCFTNGGLETGIPVRAPNGQLVQGMAGSLSGSVPATAMPEGKIARYFSADGTKLLFASEYAFEPGANSGGDLTVYERNLTAGTTEIVSTDPSGNALTGTVSGLDVSAEGSRVVFGKGVSIDAVGNEYLHPYLHIAGREGSIDLAPATTSGVLYAGMTADGSKVFFTSADKLTGEDTDNSSDLYEADVDSSGSLHLSVKTASDSDACNPVANADGEHWNSAAGVADCSAVAISGGGGVAAATGAIYFLSPESFGGQGTPNQPNLYLAHPNGSISLVGTLEPDNPLVLDSVKANATRKSGEFQTTSAGNYAAFTSTLPLSGLDTDGFLTVFRYAADADQLACTSCETSGTTEAGIAAPAELPPAGLGLAADGRVFFTTAAQLSLLDANARKDVYQWSGADPQLISAGAGPFGSELLTVSPDGEDAFFFTHDVLAPEEDRNGSLAKIYDAREGGGFFVLPAAVPCQASDECHGAGSPTPGLPDIKSSGKTSASYVLVCPKTRIKRRGQCVKKKARHKARHKKAHKDKKNKKHAHKRAGATNGKRGGRDA
jgi:hypothetical protein